MKRILILAVTTVGLMAGVVATTKAGAVSPSARGCAYERGIKTLFPRASSVGFKSRSPVQKVGRRQPFWPGWCSNWYASYRGYEGRSQFAYAQVTVSVYKSHRQALAAFNESGASSWTLPSGVRIRRSASVGSAWVQSVVRNVFISSNDMGQPGGPPDIKTAKEALRALTRIHRHIHAAVFRLR